MRSALTSFTVAVCLVTGAAGYPHARSDTGGWREIAWPFPRDGWPAGRAFRCDTALCGDELPHEFSPTRFAGAVIAC